MIFPERYSRQINLKGFGAEAQEKLQTSKVLVVGAGGLGVPALLYLAGMGVGTIGVVDGDTIGITNLNRQVLYYESEVGMSKAAVAAKKLAQQNPSIRINLIEVFLSVDNALGIIEEYDVVIDATDNFSARYLINDACVILGKPFIYGAIQEYEGHVSVFNLKDGPTYRCLYPDYPSPGEIPDCNTAGVLGVVPGIIGTHQALEAVKVITGIGKTASGYLRIFDLLNNDQYEVKLKAKPENKRIKELQDNYHAPNCSTIPTLKPKQLFEWLNSEKEFLLLDVREQEEYQQGHLVKSVLQPLSNFDVRSVASKTTMLVVTLCQKGGRSIKAANILRDYNHDVQVYSVEGGMEQWQKEMGNKLIVS
ncbi:HesA/MoeB/ThiF family protein [Segetibacter aerophilus]|uniref:Molybdopterin-synthase adenylyltransferase n=1 Tax=Segetibacter aerophilus TaxID=670293 RepID=A0A512BC80_9BACT|nr:HesA/MoeB/ThiF family protein [Segetibacter aerophilus]GEO09581.1 molybdenum cofactor biosynthesis protein MoeB [Segetibacter aerophilus]